MSSTNGVAGGLLQQGPIAVNLGLAAFADALHAQGARVVHVEWTPPAVDDETAAILDKLL
ncbi:MAG: hypothetical protein BIP78_0744 [Candidatus Bipolaricaulis sibiricus]|uniref:FdrA domain protein n=1 Tax=Bipolaricaulis sibiricus TaxID=2501609 RepID=A0A410FUB9_BIPS1|nr:MAG: hypothetical protein BIP78_0744 [Candidatus Bipolaricaulis sibiricus]